MLDDDLEFKLMFFFFHYFFFHLHVMNNEKANKHTTLHTQSCLVSFITTGSCVVGIHHGLNKV